MLNVCYPSPVISGPIALIKPITKKKKKKKKKKEKKGTPGSNQCIAS